MMRNYHYRHPHFLPTPAHHLPITLNHLISLSVIGPGDQLPASVSPVFKHMALPNDPEKPFNRWQFVNELVRVCGDYEVFPHDYVKFILNVENWSKTRIRYWQRMYDALNVEYEPLHNYDRTEIENIKEKGHKSDESSASSTVAGFNSGELVEDSGASGNSSGDHDDSRDRELRAFGNIGVTTSQEMLLAEINVAEVSMQKIIIDEFKKEFCILTY